jgi:hypothetical protein
MNSAHILSIAALAMCLASPTIAQRHQADVETTTKTQQKWDNFKAHPWLAGPSDLEAIESSRSLPATHENAKAMLDFLRSGTSLRPDQKVPMIRLAGAQVIDLDEADPTREEIRKHLSDLAKTTTDPNVGRTAALVYSRIGYYPDSTEVLRQARVKNYIANNDYFGDLAYLLPAANTEQDQAAILNALRNGRNPLSTDILATLVTNRDIAQRLKPQAAKAALALLTERPPEFSKSTNTISTMDAVGYGDWLYGCVVLTSVITGEPERTVMARLLNVDTMTAKQMIGALMNTNNINLIRDGLDRKSIAKIDSTIGTFSQNAKNSWVAQLSNDVRTQLANGPRKP